MPHRRTADATARREPGHRRLPSGKWQVFVKIKGRFTSTTFPADSGITERRAWRERARRDAQFSTASHVNIAAVFITGLAPLDVVPSVPIFSQVD